MCIIHKLNAFSSSCQLCKRRLKQNEWRSCITLRCRAEQEQFQAPAELRQQPSQQWQGLHIMSVVEQVGDDVMREHFWDYGQCRCEYQYI